jgi:hypothetical protein
MDVVVFYFFSLSHLDLEAVAISDAETSLASARDP